MKTKYKKCMLMMLSLTTAALIMHAGTHQLRYEASVALSSEQAY